jgi:hypothetical protein
MSTGTISGNYSRGSVSPHGGGGVYVAAGAFEMLGGSVTTNTSTRQGGGVFVGHNSRFSASGSSSIIGNSGVGSSKDICSRGYTELMGNAQANSIYIWNNNGNNYFTNEFDSFTLGQNARAGGIVLAHDAHTTLINAPATQGALVNTNYIIIANDVTGTDQICLIDLEGHLTGGSFVDTNISGDWIGTSSQPRPLVLGSATTLQNQVFINRLPLNTFTGGKVVNLAASYKLVHPNSEGMLLLAPKEPGE